MTHIPSGKHAWWLLLLVIALLLPSWLGFGRAAAEEGMPRLRAEVVVHGNLVTLGDLFENAGAVADVAVFRSPDLGTQGVVAARRVAAAAERHGLLWRNSSGVERVVVRRPSRMVSVEEIAALLRERIAAEMGAADASSIEVELPRTARPIHIDPQLGDPVIVKRLQFDARNGVFYAVVGLPEASAETPDQTYQGRAIETMRVAVPMRDIERGATLAEGDVTTAGIARNQLPPDAVHDAAALIGMSAKRRLVAGRPVRSFDIERPKIVRRNDIVTIVYSVPGLVLKASGRALDDGALGDSVAVLNTQSKRVITGAVRAPGEVSVAAGGASSRSSAQAGAGRGARYIVR